MSGLNLQISPELTTQKQQNVLPKKVSGLQYQVSGIYKFLVEIRSKFLLTCFVLSVFTFLSILLTMEIFRILLYFGVLQSPSSNSIINVFLCFSVVMCIPGYIGSIWFITNYIWKHNIRMQNYKRK